MLDPLTRGVLLGAPIGWLTGLALYGGIGYLVAGISGLAVGCIIATGFAVTGLLICLRFVRSISQDTFTTEVPF